MPRIIPLLFPSLKREIEALGQRLRLARLRRHYSAETVASRAGITRATLHRVEKGDGGVSMATYASVLHVLGLHHDLTQIARDDILGRKLQDLELPVRKTSSRRPKGNP